VKSTKRFFRQIIYTDDFNDSTISGLFKTLGKRILADLKVIYDSLEFKLQTILEPESEKNLIFKQNKFPTFASILEVLGTRQKNKFYPANPSLWVVFISCFMGILIIIFVSILHSQDFITVVYKQFGVAIVGSILCITFWVSLFYKEKVYGYHTDIIRKNITLSFWIFLFTEGLCFMSLFWTFFHSLLAASSHIGQFAPGEGVVNYYLNEDLIMHPYWSVFLYTDMTDAKVHNFPDDITNRYTYDHTLVVRFHFNLFDFGQLIDPYGYPALNTALLLISATVLTSGHAKLKMGKYLKSFIFLALTLLLGIVFLCVQFLEIKGSTLQYNDGIYACSFYSLTGLHGIHVILGVFALFLCFINFIKGNYTRKRHDTFWCAVAYWHFVDVVWVLVYLLIYCWPSCLYFSDGVRYSYLGYKDYCFNINTKVFEKSLFEKIVNDDISLSFEIVNFYLSNPIHADYISAQKIFKTLIKCHVKAGEQLIKHSENGNYLVQPDVIIRYPKLDKQFFEKHEYNGFGFFFQPEFSKEDLRKTLYYKHYYNKINNLESIKKGYYNGVGSFYFQNRMKLLSQDTIIIPEMISLVKDSLEKKYLSNNNNELLNKAEHSNVNFKLGDNFVDGLNLYYEKYFSSEEEKKKFLDDKIKNASWGKNFNLNVSEFVHKLHHPDIEDRKNSNLAIAPIEPASKTLSEVAERETRKKSAIELLAINDYALKKKIKEGRYVYSPYESSLALWAKENVIARPCPSEPYIELKVKQDYYRYWPSVACFYTDVVSALSNLSGKEKSLIYISKDWIDFDENTIIDIILMYNDPYFELIQEELEKREKRLKEVINLKKNKIDIHLTYFELYRTRKYMNYSELKNDKHLYAVFLNVLHPLAFDYLDRWAVSDFRTWRGKIKFPILFILYYININWAFTFAARFTPYFLTSDYKFMWGDLLYTRKPKWALKKD